MPDDDISLTWKTNFKLSAMEEHMGNKGISKVLHEYGKYLVGEVKSRFLSGSGPSGGKWKNIKKFPGVSDGRSKAMIKTGNLMNSVAFYVFEDMLQVGVSLDKFPYAKLLHYGGTHNTTVKQSIWMFHNLVMTPGAKIRPMSPFAIKKIVTPARPFLGFSRKNKTMFHTIMGEHAKKLENLTHTGSDGG